MSHPYISGAGNISQMLTHLRKNFPKTVTSDTVKTLGIAPNNESYVINALQFIGIIDEKGNKTERGTKVFSLHSNEEFQPAFDALVREGYKDLFDLHGDEAWKMDRNALVSYFRKKDETSATIGLRQATVFQMFAGCAGHGKVEVKATTAAAAKNKPTVKKPAKGGGGGKGGGALKRDMALTVRIEINLPADGTRETYDNIFQSIKANLLNE